MNAILYFSRCLVDGKVRELVTGRDVTVEESDFVYLHLFFKINILVSLSTKIELPRWH